MIPGDEFKMSQVCYRLLYGSWNSRRTRLMRAFLLQYAFKIAAKKGELPGVKKAVW